MNKHKMWPKPPFLVLFIRVPFHIGTCSHLVSSTRHLEEDDETENFSGHTHNRESNAQMCESLAVLCCYFLFLEIQS